MEKARFLGEGKTEADNVPYASLESLLSTHLHFQEGSDVSALEWQLYKGKGGAGLSQSVLGISQTHICSLK